MDDKKSVPGMSQMWEEREEGWMSGVRDAVEKRGMTVEKASMVCQNRNEWRAIVYGGGIFSLTRLHGRERGNQLL